MKLIIYFSFSIVNLWLGKNGETIKRTVNDIANVIKIDLTNRESKYTPVLSEYKLNKIKKSIVFKKIIFTILLSIVSSITILSPFLTLIL